MFEGWSDVPIKTFVVNSVVVSSVLLVAPEKKLFRKHFIVIFLTGRILVSCKCVSSCKCDITHLHDETKISKLNTSKLESC